jgi:hypothetical protein
MAAPWGYFVEALQAPCGSRCCIGMIRMYMGSYIRHVHIHTSAYIYIYICKCMYMYVYGWTNWTWPTKPYITYYYM